MMLHRFFYSVFLLSMLHGLDYEYYFDNRYDDAISIYEKIRPLMEERISKLDGEFDCAMSIIFPELLRYSLIRDKIETAALEVFYKKLGHDYANFSIGLFQMKPLFIERLEKEIIGFDDLERYHFISEYDKELGDEEVREVRLSRLKDIHWQIDYLISFMKIMDRNIESKNERSKVRLYSTAFNCGIWDNVEKIDHVSNKNLFPYGMRSNKNICSYSDLSLHFFSSYLN